MYLKEPPRIKVLEALGAIADGRVKVINEEECEVISSEGDRRYRVIVKGNKFYSDDNGTKFRGYVGYPIISCLMVKGVLPFDKALSDALKGIPWRKLNETLKNYSKVEGVIYEIVGKRGFNREDFERFINGVLRKLGELRPTRLA